MITSLVVLPFLFMIGSAGTCMYLVKKGANRKKTFLSQIISTGIVSLSTFAFSAFSVIRADEVVSNEISIGYAMGLIAAALALGLAALSAGIAFASAIPAAIAAMSENEKTFGKSMVFAIIAETIAIYGLLVSILILNKLG
jgi:V/A-type H+-transporting ATPase subunit K